MMNKPLPEARYSDLVTDKLRFTSTISSRLASLGAITRGQWDTGCSSGLFNIQRGHQ
jgi:hypothetical protein